MRLEWSRDALRLTGLSPRALSRLRAIEGAGWDRWLRIYPADLVRTGAVPWDVGLPTVSGHWEVDDDAARFVPRFPFVRGTSYTVLFDPALCDDALLGDMLSEGLYDLDEFSSLTITREQLELEPVTRVVEIYPTSAEIPRNQLKLYIEFSQPMSEGHAATLVSVQHAATGEPVAGAFLPMEPELWDPGRRRLTVLFDPARLKRGLAPHEQAGYPLHQGTAVDIVVSDSFRDAAGRLLTATFSKRYEVGPDVRALVDPNAWSIGVPDAATNDPLVVRFDRPLDAGLLEHCLSVVDNDDQPVEGVVHLPLGEREWQFRPDSPWADNRYELLVDAILEDLAGNSVARVFDRDLTDPAHTPATTARVSLAFTPRHQP